MRTIGKFTILDETPIYNEKRHCTMLRCRCDCGRELYVNKYTLDDGKSVSCRKCFGKTLYGDKNPNFKGFKDIPSSIISRNKRQANRRGIPWELNIRELCALYCKQGKKCAMTKLPILFSDKTASLDRIDSTKGYTLDNVQWVHKNVNLMKNGFEIEYFTYFCKLVAKNLKEIRKTSKFIYGKH